MEYGLTKLLADEIAFHNHKKISKPKKYISICYECIDEINSNFSKGFRASYFYTGYIIVVLEARFIKMQD